MTTELIRMRPFERYIGHEPGVPVVEMRGEIRAATFVVTVLHQEVVLETSEVGEDAHGPYVVVTPCERSLRDGFKLRVLVECEEDEPPGGGINVFLPGVSMSPERAFGVHFNAGGTCHGYSSAERPLPEEQFKLKQKKARERLPD